MRLSGRLVVCKHKCVKETLDSLDFQLRPLDMRGGLGRLKKRLNVEFFKLYRDTMLPIRGEHTLKTIEDAIAEFLASNGIENHTRKTRQITVRYVEALIKCFMKCYKDMKLEPPSDYKNFLEILKN